MAFPCRHGRGNSVVNQVKGRHRVRFSRRDLIFRLDIVRIKPEYLRLIVAHLPHYRHLRRIPLNRLPLNRTGIIAINQLNPDAAGAILLFGECQRLRIGGCGITEEAYLNRRIIFAGDRDAEVSAPAREPMP